MLWYLVIMRTDRQGLCIAFRWTHEVFSQSPSPTLGEGFGVRAVPYIHENRCSILSGETAIASRASSCTNCLEPLK
ncbi:MAG: hypothetical protein ACRC8Y_26445 [Chroococcales cyanobacterium]